MNNRVVLSLIILLTIHVSAIGQRGQYVFASQYRITEEDLAGYSRNELMIMRSEILARYGMIFSTADLRKHFNAQSWYEPTSKDVSDELTSIERDNILLITDVEKKTTNGLSHNGKHVRALVPHAISSSSEEISGYLLVEYQTRPISWTVYELQLSSSDNDFDNIDFSEIDEANLSSLVTRKRLINATSIFIAEGSGSLPKFVQSGYHSDNIIIEHDGKKMSLSRYVEGWYDYQLIGGGHKKNVLLPNKKQKGAVGGNTIQKILVKDGDRGFVYETTDGEVRFVSTVGDFPVERWSYKTKSIIVLGGAFVVNNNNQWQMFNESRTSGIVLPIETSYDLQYRNCNNGYYSEGEQYCSYTFIAKDDRVRYLLYFGRDVKLYKLPSRTRIVEGNSVSGNSLLAVPGYGRVRIDASDDDLRFFSDGEDEDLSEFEVDL